MITVSILLFVILSAKRIDSMPTFADLIVLFISFLAPFLPLVVGGSIVGLLLFGLRRMLLVNQDVNPRQAAYDEAAEYGVSREEVDANFMDAYSNE